MKYLLDVNALFALGQTSHALHTRAATWYANQLGTVEVFTCSITELGFVRTALNTRTQPDLASALAILAGLKKSGGFRFLADDLGVDSLPAYVKTARETTDGHLLALARRHGAKFATFDAGIPGAELMT